VAIIEGLSHSKVNLFLHVLGKRADGYHDLYTLFYATGLTDRIFLESAIDTSLICNLPYVPTDKRNIILKIDAILREKYGLRENFKITVEKSIPVGAGLGGGSGNAACYLKLVNEAAGLNIPFKEMEKILASVGSDTVFFLNGSQAIGEGRGEKISPVEALPKFHLLLVNPGVSISTADIYASSKLILTKKTDLPKLFASLTVSGLKDIMWNALQPAAQALFPLIGDLCRKMEEAGAAATLMSGSGPTVFGIFTDATLLQEAYEKLLAECPKEYKIWALIKDQRD
jgi:4-diphosphocytidyl-2-C-methyl-D-erythritol kinase